MLALLLIDLLSQLQVVLMISEVPLAVSAQAVQLNVLAIRRAVLRSGVSGVRRVNGDSEVLRCGCGVDRARLILLS